jgi:2,4-dienoyl-CoA reductase-like NADH-dependent reductase (Old Yellow Enzyme family)
MKVACIFNKGDEFVNPKYQNFLSPFAVGSLVLKNRAVLPGLTSNFSGIEGEVTDQLIYFLRRRAEGGAGLIFVESVFVDWSGKGTPRELGIHDDRLIPGLKKLTDAIHRAGAKIMPQLVHCGRQMTSAFSNMPLLAPSAIPDPVIGEMPKEMTIEEIRFMVEQFAKAVQRAKVAGFDGVEIQAGHGYLISQFISPYANKRLDEYGGCLQHRMRFLREIIERSRLKVGDDFPIVCRINAEEYVEDGIHLNEAVKIAKMLEDWGVDAIDVSVSVKESYHYLSVTTGEPIANQAQFAEEIKVNISIPVITAGRILTPEIAEEILRDGQADLVAIGRGMIADPDFVRKAENNQITGLIPCIGCNACNARSHRPQTICIVNSEVGREYELNKYGIPDKMKIGIIGSSLAGLEAAKVALEKGHHVQIFEPTERLGGLFGDLRSRVPGEEELRNAVTFYSRKLQELGAEIHFHSSVDEKDIKEYKFDILYVALAGVPGPLYKEADALYAIDVLKNTSLNENSYTLIGNGLLVAETALFIASQGKEVTLVYDQDAIVTDAHPTIRHYVRKRLEKSGVILRKVEKIDEGIFSLYNNVIQAHSFSEESLKHKYILAAREVIYLGDSFEASDLAERVWRAGELAVRKGVSL